MCKPCAGPLHAAVVNPESVFQVVLLIRNVGRKLFCGKIGEGSAFPRMTAALRFPGCVGKEEGWWLGGGLGEQQQS